MEQLPRQFGRYLLQEELGRGGMGAVYLAHDDVMNADVAVKLPHFSRSEGTSALERFYREARVMFGLRHPGICPVHDVGEIDGQHYLVMAFIRGTTLSAYLSKHPRLSCLQAAKLIRKVALAVQAAHESGIIHRDLKPANIMLDASGEPVVMDFGLAHAGAGDDSRITRTGTIMGTPAYMPPEQADGSLQEQGPRTDVYSLGVVLYEILTGRLPFEGAVTSILAQIARDEPPPPREINPDVDDTMNGICLKAMSKKPADRFESMRAFSEELAAYIRSAREKPTLPLPEARTPTDGLRITQAATAAGGSVRLKSTPSAAEQETRYSTAEGATQPSLVATGRSQASSRHRKPLWIAGGTVLAVVVVSALLRPHFRPMVTPQPPAPVQAPAKIDPVAASNAAANYELVLDGRNAYVELPTLMYDGTHPLTLEMWVTPVSVLKAPFQRLIGCVDEAVVALDIVAMGEKYCAAAAGMRGGLAFALSDERAVVGKRVHIAGIFASGGLTLYVDGRKQSDWKVVNDGKVKSLSIAPFGQIKQTRHSMQIGCVRSQGALQRFFGGNIDEVRVSRIARYTEDFQPVQRFASDDNTLALYHCDEGERDVLVDSSGNERHGKVFGGTWKRTEDVISKPSAEGGE